MDLIPAPSRSVAWYLIPLIHWPLLICLAALGTSLAAVPLVSDLQDAAITVSVILYFLGAIVGIYYYSEDGDRSAKDHFLDTPDQRLRLMAHDPDGCPNTG